MRRFQVIRSVGWIIAVLVTAGAVLAEDEIELLSGARVQGKIIERTEQSLKIQTAVDGRLLIRTYPLNRLRAVTTNGRRQALVPDAAEAAKPGPAVSSGVGANPAQPTPTALDTLIEEKGRTPPEWFEATPLEYPGTLDLSWPEPAPVIWNYTRNVDHYLWDIIYTNSKRYRSGVQLMHHLLVVNQTNENTRARIMNELGRMYFEFFQDYSRAAFWWRQANVEQHPGFSDSPSAARLAECYWRLGDRPGAVELLERLPLTPAVIKAWGDLKETDKALRLCEEGLERGFLPTQVHLLAGDACRAAGDFTRAAGFYRKVLEAPAVAGKDQEMKRDRDRAQSTIEVMRLFDALDLSRVGDGTYEGKSLGYSGNVEVAAVVKGGRIQTIRIVSHSDRQYYHAIEETIRRILERQTVNGVDAISGATITSEAVIRASARALADGMSTNTP